MKHPSPDPAADRPAAPRVETRSPFGRRRWDTVLSVGLLVYGLLNVLSGLVQYADLGAYIDEVYRTFGIGEYASTGMERPIGIAIVASNLISFALAAWFTVRNLRAGRIAFWIPIVGGAIATIASAIFLQILIGNDPALAAYLDGLLGR